MIVTTQSLVAELIRLGVRSVDAPRDETAFLCSPEWLTEFGEWFKKYVTQSWLASKFDCDDFAIRAIDRATESLVRAGNLDDCGHAFCYAEIYLSTGASIFTVQGPAWHAVNLVRCSDAWHYFEPQTGQHDLLSRFLDDESLAVIRRVWL